MDRTTRISLAGTASVIMLGLVAPICSPVVAQEAQALRVGQTLSGTLSGDSQHDYTLELGADQFVFGDANQIDVDVVVTILDPAGEQVAEFDSPARGPEVFQFTTEAEGTYVVRVTPFEEQSGSYEVTVRLAERVATDPAKRVDQLMMPFSGNETPGGVVGVVDGGRVVFEKAYGMASLEYGVRHATDTPTNIGSVTKQFTAMAILLLQEDGKLSLDDDVREHVPELPDFGVTITLKNMLNHVTGYRELYNFLPMSGRQGEDHIARVEAIEIIQRQPDLQDPPNTLFNYNNTGYVLLATIVERISGQTFPEFMSARVFRPLGMNDTRVKYAQGEIIPGASQGYAPGPEGGWVSTRDLAAAAGAGGIYTTFRDMTRWMANYRDKTVGGPAAIEALTTRNILESGDTTPYALGLGIGKMRGLDIYQHTGGDVAHRTYFAYFPSIDAGVFMSSNNASFPTGLGGQVARLFFDDRMEPVEAGDEAEAGEATADNLMPMARMEAIVGDWFIEVANLPSVFSIEDGQLVAVPEGQNKVILTATSDSTVEHTALQVTINFRFEDDGTVNNATFTQGQALPMRRVVEEDLTLEDLERFVGRYYSDELTTWLDIGVDIDEEGDEPKLSLDNIRVEPVSLTHRAGTVFSGPFPYVEVEFQRAGNGTVTGLVTGNGRVTGVLFERR
ncbi:MAG: serine hydrolase [Gemmatimonadetes bacterium]|nr:serine hydrolase [Gemmatimonadota bacterium]MDA1104586.1 serine hydrolase [Gemmatimonadota bacterium]